MTAAVPSTADRVRQRFREALEAERRQVLAEIRAYPTPIPACDAQFNHLLAQRQSLEAELLELAALPEGAEAEQRVPGLASLVERSRHLAPDMRQALLAPRRGEP